MSVTVDVLSEPMPSGGGKIEGAPALVGHLSLASLLVREAVQNAWDARDDERGADPVIFSIDGYQLRANELQHLRKLMPVDDLPGYERHHLDDDGTSPLHPSSVFERAPVGLLVVSDRNTVGLCGPTRSGREWDPIRRGEPFPEGRGQQRFANFLRNSGRASSDTGQGDGGAFGVGKNALWMTSRIGTVLVHTRTTDAEGKPIERFMGSVLGEHFYADGNEFTGRHFIGRRDGDLVEPLIGKEAAEAVAGLPHPGYLNHDGQVVDGTTVFIVDPVRPVDAEGNDDWLLLMDLIADAIRWQVWPKRVSGARRGRSGPDMDFRLSFNGKPQSLPKPEDDPEIAPYAAALGDCVLERHSSDDGSGADVEARCGQPVKHLGWTRIRRVGTAADSVENTFSITQTAKNVSDRLGLGADDEAGVAVAVDFEGPFWQIALIRREPLLLVRYEPLVSRGQDVGEAPPAVGVFLSADDEDVEAALTKAEPPAHDDWIYQNVPKVNSRDGRRTYVKRAVENVKAARRTFWQEVRARKAGDAGAAGQEVSAKISEGFGGLGGRLKPSSPTPSGGKAAKPRANLRYIGAHDGPDAVEHEVEVTFDGPLVADRRYAATASVAGRDSTGAIGVDHLATVSWSDTGSAEADGATLFFVADIDPLPPVTLIVRATDDVRLRPLVKISEVDDGA